MMPSRIARFFNWGRQAATVPSMDGALRPNQALDGARPLAAVDAPDNLVAAEDGLYFTSGAQLFQLNRNFDHETIEKHRFESDITALAAAADGSLAVATAPGGIVLRGGPHDGKTIAALGGKPLIAVTALAFAGPDNLLVAVGSTVNAAADWQADLLDGRTSGAVWRVDLRSLEAVQLAGNLGYPCGLLADGDRIVVSEAWRHRLIALAADGRGAPRVLLDDLPGYPGRLSPATGAGAWLSVFAPRSQLIEFVLQEASYRRWMMQEVDKAYWIAPSLRAGRSFKEPMQGGAVKTLGIHKPWSPTRSYGLAVRLNGDFVPTRSFHSRADGRRHGVTSCIETDGRLVLTCRGDNVVVALDLDGNGEA